MTRECDKQANRRYQDKYIVRYQIKLNRRTDPDLIEYLDRQPNKTGLIKRLLREEMERDPR